MTDPKAGKANIKKKKPVPNYELPVHGSSWEDWPHQFQRNLAVTSKVEVSDYNSKAGTLPL